MQCYMMALAFFDEEALDEFNEQVEEWNSQDLTVEEDVSEETKEDIPDNPLEDFDVSRVVLNMYSEETDELKASYTITGETEEDIEKTTH